MAKVSRNRAPRVGMVSLGCPKALVDSERILTQLRTEGYELSGDYDGADLVIVNTCGFIDSARDESLQAIGEALAENGRVIVTGCMGKNAQDITRVHPGVLAVSGPQQYEQVMEAVRAHTPTPGQHDPRVDLVPPQGLRLTPRHYAYLKISEGCNHRCSFCIIPSMRGRLASRPAGDVMREAERLVRAGVKELLVISQDTSAYGSDLKYQGDFWRDQLIPSRLDSLCEALGRLGAWVRLHYVYPYPHVDRLLPLMAAGRVLPYLDVPLQHGDPEILRLMRRPAAAENTLRRIEAWRSTCPDLVIRSTFIVGFPGETEANFETLLEFLREARLDRVGCFQYSPVEGAAANELPGEVPDEIKAEREARFMALQARISREKLEARVGQTLKVLVDEVGDTSLVGRSYADAPEIDGQVYADRLDGIRPGDFVDVEIESAGEHDLWGRTLNDASA